MMYITRRFLVSGRVQGVGFRYFTLQAALRHKITGWVRNLDDSSVEIWAEGPESSIEEFKQEISVGPKLANVVQISEFTITTVSEYRTFEIY